VIEGDEETNSIPDNTENLATWVQITLIAMFVVDFARVSPLSHISKV